ncbi:CHAT domain-containing protein [Mycena latifolia]|nr:CHAT domain-containing protein [Mycena latifolia]
MEQSTPATAPDAPDMAQEAEEIPIGSAENYDSEADSTDMAAETEGIVSSRSPTMDTAQATNYFNKAHILLMECKAAANISSLNTAIYLLTSAAFSWSPTDPQFRDCINYLVTGLLTRFTYTGKAVDVHKAVSLAAETISGLPSHNVLVHMGGDIYEHEDLPDMLKTVALIITDFHHAHDWAALANAIMLYQEALKLLPENYPQRWKILWELADGLMIQFHLTGNEEQHDEAVICLLEMHPIKPNRSICLCAALLAGYHPTALYMGIDLTRDWAQNNMKAVELADRGAELLQLFITSQDDSLNLDTAIQALEEAESLLSWGHHERPALLINLGASLRLRFQYDRNEADLESAIEVLRESVALYDYSDPSRSGALNNLANALHMWFKQQGDPKAIHEAIELHRAALELHPASHPDHTNSLNNLAAVIATRFEEQGDPKDIDEAIKLFREALELRPVPHPDRSSSLKNLAKTVQARFMGKGDPKDIDEVIELHREALELRAAPHPGRSSSFINLASAISTRFGQRGDPKDIDEAIELLRRALLLHSPPHPDHSISLHNLAAVLHTRFEERGDPRDIDEAIELHRSALKLHGTTHAGRSAILSALAAALGARSGQQEDVTDIDEAIVLLREAVKLCDLSQPGRSVYINNLATALHTRFREQGDAKDIDEAIELHRAALELCAIPHPGRSSFLSSLATAICARFNHQHDLKDINEAIELHRAALELRPAPHPQRGSSLHSLATTISFERKHQGDIKDIDESIDLLKEASTYPYSSLLSRSKAANAWATIAVMHRHSSCLAAYRTSIDLLPQLAAFHLDLNSRHRMLTRSGTTYLASISATCAIVLHEYNVAVEFLESSRSIFWAQALHLRTPLDQLANIRPDLAMKLRELSSQLEHTSFRDTARNLGSDPQQKAMSIEAEAFRCRKLNEDWESAIKSVQMLPGFEDFMQPKRITTLRQAARSGPIVILLAVKTICSALIVTFSNDVEHVHLPEIDLRTVEAYADLPHALSRSDFSISEFLEAHGRGEDTSDQFDLAARLSGAQENLLNMSPDDLLRGQLADIWKTIVKPVFAALNLKKSENPARLWWCPTGPFTFLPIHAAGIYDTDGTDCVSDYVVSSYTPTLAGLLDPPVHAATTFKMTVVAEPNAPNCSPLPGTEAEAIKIKSRVPNQWLTCLRSTTRSKVVEHLQESSIVHFACHGIQDSYNPLDSGLRLSDGRLKVSQIMQRPENAAIDTMNNAMSLAFLSACETAKGHGKTPDEAMHLAASLLFAGFRGVVATMWSIDDRDGPKIADTFYEHLFKHCDATSDPPVLPELSKAAEALHLAAAKLRKEPGMSFKRWVPFVHYGL